MRSPRVTSVRPMPAIARRTPLIVPAVIWCSRAVALVGHETFCYDDLSVAENVRFVARSTGHRAADADDALERVGLRRVAHITHGRLSQGQRRRLSLANALVRKPRLLLLDEPHAGLDEHGRAVLEEIVREARGEDRTVMLA